MGLKVFKKSTTEEAVAVAKATLPATDLPSTSSVPKGMLKPKPKKAGAVEGVTINVDQVVTANATSPLVAIKEAMASITKTKTVNHHGVKDIVQTDSTEKVGQVVATKPFGMVNVEMGVTRNLGNFESVKLHVSLSYPSTVDNFDSTFDIAKDWVNSKLDLLNKQIDDELSA
jgi:hypothetical protein